jgi:wyosine [tRNA(Phe)-imidazoG37] synthetase (radical SAM superfamily)
MFIGEGLGMMKMFRKAFVESRAAPTKIIESINLKREEVYMPTSLSADHHRIEIQSPMRSRAAIPF